MTFTPCTNLTRQLTLIKQMIRQIFKAIQTFSASIGNLYNGNLYNGNLYNGNLYNGNLYNGNLYNGNLYNGNLYFAESNYVHVIHCPIIIVYSSDLGLDSYSVEVGVGVLSTFSEKSTLRELSEE